MPLSPRLIFPASASKGGTRAVNNKKKKSPSRKSHALSSESRRVRHSRRTAWRNLIGLTHA